MLMTDMRRLHVGRRRRAIVKMAPPSRGNVRRSVIPGLNIKVTMPSFATIVGIGMANADLEGWGRWRRDVNTAVVRVNGEVEVTPVRLSIADEVT